MTVKIDIELVMPLKEAVIFVEPVAMGIAKPLLLPALPMVATFVADDVHTDSYVISSVLPSE